MRKFKFRVWFKEENSYLQNYDGNNFFDYDGKLLDLGWFIKCAENPNDGRFIVEQWTGFTDKEGNDIYEGDIIHIGDCEYVVGFNEFLGRWMAYLNIVSPMSEDNLELFANCEEDCKIIGNINQK